MENHIIVAVDPGASGGIACHSVIGGVESLTVIPMPKTEGDFIHFMHGIKCKAELNNVQVYMYLEEIRPWVPKDRVFAILKLYGNYKFLLGVFQTLGFKVVVVGAAKWQSFFSLGRKKGKSATKWKNELKSEAQRRFPTQKVTLKTADALLILEYGLKSRC
jgi:hypothetical protein